MSMAVTMREPNHHLADERASPSLSRTQIGIGLLLACITLVAVSATVNDAGITWDEPLYMKASRTYMSWFGVLKQGILSRDLGEALSDEAIVAGWMPHPTLELHPPLGKILSGLSFAALRGIWGEIAALRFSNSVLFSLLVAMVFWWVASVYGTTSGVFAALSLVLMPRMFFHAHLANSDTAVATTWFLAMYAYWRYESRRGWLPVFVMGVAFGLALGTKMNAIVMPLVWGIWVLLFQRNRRSILRLVAITAIGGVVFVAMWPWLYHDTANRLVYYILMAFRFKDRPQFYLGQTWPHVPWHYPFVITAAVVPLATVVMSLLGSLQVFRRKLTDSAGWLVILNAVTPLLFAATGLQAAYSGERHFIPAYPYLACLAGIGFGSTLHVLGAAQRFSGRAGIQQTQSPSQARWGRVRVLGVALLLLLLFVPPMVSMIQVHPYELSYYSELVGGLPGATRLGLETTFWCETYNAALPYLNVNAQSGASVWVENPFVLRTYQRNGLLRQDIEATGGDIISPYAADYALVQIRETGFSYYTPETAYVVQHETPVYTLTRQGVALLRLYKLR
jgi:4-amino-4-deoxy-L-arabinose transferase-like glycosyltransferase